MSSLGYSAELLRKMYGDPYTGSMGVSGGSLTQGYTVPQRTGAGAGSAIGGSMFPARQTPARPPAPTSDPFGQDEPAWQGQDVAASNRANTGPTGGAYSPFNGNQAGPTGSRQGTYRTNPVTGALEYIPPVGNGQAPSSAYRAPGTSRVGSVDYNAVGNLSGYLDMNPDAAGAMRAQGVMPTYNGMALDQLQNQGGGGQWNPQFVANTATYNPTMALPAYGSGAGQGLGNFRPNARDLQNPVVQAAMGQGGAGGMGGPGAGGGGGMGAVPRTGLPLEQTSEDAYQRLIQGGGSATSPFQDAAARNRLTDGYNRATSDAVQQARIDAQRRGVSPESLPDLEARIRARGADQGFGAGLDFDRELQTGNYSRLMQALGGGQQLFGTQLGNLQKLRELMILEQQVGQGASPFQYVTNLGGR